MFCEVLFKGRPGVSDSWRFDIAVCIRRGKLRVTGSGTGSIFMFEDRVDILGLTLLNLVVAAIVCSFRFSFGHVGVRGLQTAEATQLLRSYQNPSEQIP